jgi:hypothetical protein
MKKGFTVIEVLILLALIATIVFAFFVMAKPVRAANDCGGFFQPSCENSTNVERWTNTQKKEAVATEENQRRLLKNQPVPKINESTERANLIRRLNTFNDPNKVSYIYLVNYGKVMAFYTIKGKVSSVNSMLTTTEQVVNKDGNQCEWGNSSGDCYVVSSPDIDGSYGSNGEAIFFFTTDGTYVEWHGDYMLADQPLKLTTQPELVREIK